MRIRSFLVPLVAAVGLVAAGCGDSSSGNAGPGATTGTPTATSPVTTAKPSGSITIYSGRSETLVKPLFDQFTKDTGITVQFRTGDSGELAAQILTEGARSQADVFFSQDAGALGAVSKAKLFDALAKEAVDAVPAAYRAKDATWVGVSGRVRVILYNPKLVPNPPTRIDQVLDPAWKDKVGFAPTNASWQSFVTAMRVLRGESEAAKWLDSFAKNSPKAYQGNAAVRDAVDKGEVALGLVNHYYLFEKIAKDGADKVTAKNQFLPGDVGGLINVAGAGVLSSSKNKPAAMAFVQYLLNAESQKYFAEKTFEYPLISSVAPAAAVPALSTLNPAAIDLSDLASIDKTQEALAKAGLLTK